MITRSRASYRRPFRIASPTLSVLLLALCYFGALTLGFDFVGIYAVALIAASPAIALMGRKGIAAAYLLLASAPFLHANAYCKMLGTETPANFHDVLPPIDIEQARSCRKAWRCRPCKNADKCYGLDRPEPSGRFIAHADRRRAMRWYFSPCLHRESRLRASVGEGRFLMVEASELPASSFQVMLPVNLISMVADNEKNRTCRPDSVKCL